MAGQDQGFSVGDIVKLKSGGPNMTVLQVRDGDSVIITCQWFAGKKLESGRFNKDSLATVAEE